ncbi:MAG TPA: class I SAM-dependent methyltransferase [Planctomycetota bacterium]|nr:class I SAM-dependent methyltransferase [Planctomycetota bacterium]
MVDRAAGERVVAIEADMAVRRRLLTIVEWLEPAADDRVLDAGCGRGFYLRFLRELSAAELFGVELELPIVARARTALRAESGIHLVLASLPELPFADSSFDKVILSEVLEHVPDDGAALREVARVVRRGGLIAITVPNADYPFWWDPINKSLEACFGTHVSSGPLAGIWANHVRLYRRGELRDLVASQGLELVAERAFTHHSFPFLHNLVYGLGKPLLEGGVLPRGMADAADRYATDGRRGSLLNPVNAGLRLFELFDRRNRMEEPEGRSTVNVCALARVR